MYQMKTRMEQLEDNIVKLYDENHSTQVQNANLKKKIEELESKVVELEREILTLLPGGVSYFDKDWIGY
jgi:predicted  nucleic acid-binding Zn-ribbon protein